ncbi:hypothetical protein [Streptomyces sp. NRRL B-24720]|uniref:hypothetical protein n=1 Tax=Streptomyces sp. NRRL B-24720 TaxID=1476876 RepID=UPI000691150D|nr:hypothetical protein [Streptomyces sp. NRRL B-24720]
MAPPSIRTIRNCRLEGAGWEWDAVRVPRSVGLDALAILGGRSGAVLEDPLTAALYWFIAPGSRDDWDVPGTRILAEDAHLVIPPHRRTQGPGPHWRVCPGDDEWVTEAAALQAALEDAAGPRLGAEHFV